MNINAYNKSEGDLNFYDRDDSSKFNLFGTESDTFRDLLNTVDAIIPEQDSHLLPEQDTSLMDMCSSFDKRMDFSDFDTRNDLFSDSPQLLSDAYHTSSPGAIGGFSAPMNSVALPNLSPASERRRTHKKTKKRATRDDHFSPPDNLYPDSNRLPVASGISGYPPYSNNLCYEENYREDEVPVINFNDNDQFSVINYGDYRSNDSNSEYQSNNVTESNDILYSAMTSANFSPRVDSEDSVSQDCLNSSNFSASMEAEDNVSQDFNDTEQIDYSKLSDAEKYRRLRDLNNKASQDYRRRKKEKVSEVGNQMPELEEKHRKLTNKSQQLESLRNEVLQYYNMKFNTQYRPQEVLLLKR